MLIEAKVMLRFQVHGEKGVVLPKTTKSPSAELPQTSESLPLYKNITSSLERILDTPDDPAPIIKHNTPHITVTSDYSQFKSLPYFAAMEKEIAAAVEKHNISNPSAFMSLSYSVMETESHFRPRLVSTAGAIGLMQVMPESAMLVDYSAKEIRAMKWRTKAKMLREYRQRLFDPATNIHYGIALLAEGHDYWSEQEDDPTRAQELIIAEYNSGRDNTIKHFLDTPSARQIPETRHYVAKVKKAYAWYKHGPSVPFYLAQQHDT